VEREGNFQQNLCVISQHTLSYHREFSGTFLCGQGVCYSMLQRVQNAAARFVSCTLKFDRGLSHQLHADLYWLDIRQIVRYYSDWQCDSVCNMSPEYLIIWWTQVAGVCWHLRSGSRKTLFVTVLARSVVGPSLLPVRCAYNLRYPSRSTASFRTSLKTALFMNKCI